MAAFTSCTFSGVSSTLCHSSSIRPTIFHLTSKSSAKPLGLSLISCQWRQVRRWIHLVGRPLCSVRRCLHYRALVVGVRAKDTAVSLLGSQHGLAGDAFVEELACVSRHNHCLLSLAFRTGQCRVYYCFHVSFLQQILLGLSKYVEQPGLG